MNPELASGSWSFQSNVPKPEFGNKKNPDVKAEYDALEKEFALFDELLNARMQAGLTQAEVADRMHRRLPDWRPEAETNDILPQYPRSVNMPKQLAVTWRSDWYEVEPPGNAKLDQILEWTEKQQEK